MNGITPDQNTEYNNEKTKETYLIAERAVLLLGAKKSRTRESIESALINPYNEKYSEECDIYLFETVVSSVYKYGISNDFIGRALKCGKDEKARYHKFVWNFRCTTRLEAFCIEQAIIRLHGTSSFYINRKPKLSAEQNKQLFPPNGSQEITAMSPDEFQDLVTMLHEEWEAMDLYKFTKKHCPWNQGFYDHQIEELIDGSCFIRKQQRDGKEVLAIWNRCYSDIKWDEYCVHLIDLPMVFEKLYGYSFFPINHR